MRLCGIGLYEPAELVMSAQVGTPLAEIEARLADNQQQLAFEPPDYGALLGGEPGRGTIGGVIACNLSGPRRIKAGAARDHFLGVRAVTGRGDAIKSGGRVVKNVTGYDLCKLFAGSFGTLVAMTEVTFKVLPAAEHEATLLLRARTRAAGFAALRRAMNSAGDVAGAACLPAAAAARSSVPAIAAGGADLAALRLEGPAPSVRARVDGLKALLAGEGELDELTPAASAALWREIRDVTLLPAGGPLWRVSVPPAAGAPLLEALERELRLAWLADWAGGLLWLAVDDADDAGAAAIRKALCAAWRACHARAGQRRAARCPPGIPAAGTCPCAPQRPGQRQLRSQAHPQSGPDVCGGLSVRGPGPTLAGPSGLLDQADLAIVPLRARMQRDGDAFERGLERDLPRLAVAVVQQLAGVLVPQRFGDAVHQLLLDLGADQPLGTDAERRGLADARIGAGGNRCPWRKTDSARAARRLRPRRSAPARNRRRRTSRRPSRWGTRRRSRTRPAAPLRSSRPPGST